MQGGAIYSRAPPPPAKKRWRGAERLRPADADALFATIDGAIQLLIADDVVFGTIAYAASAFTGAVPWSSHIVRNIADFGVASSLAPSDCHVPMRDSRVTLSAAFCG